jgi:hypothetical protein
MTMGPAATQAGDGGARMNLTPREKDKLRVEMASIVARKRFERGNRGQTWSRATR